MTLVDGNHRVVKLHELGRDSVRVYLFAYPVWQQFLIDMPGYDETSMSRESKILEIEETQHG